LDIIEFGTVAAANCDTFHEEIPLWLAEACPELQFGEAR